MTGPADSAGRGDIERLARVLHNEFSRINEPGADWCACTDEQKERWRRSARVVAQATNEGRTVLQDAAPDKPPRDHWARKVLP